MKSLVSPFPAFHSTASPLEVDKLRIELTICDNQQVLSLVEASKIQVTVDNQLLIYPMNYNMTHIYILYKIDRLI